MKILFLTLIVSVNMNFLWAMENSNDDENEIWREQLIVLCEDYRSYLPSQYACSITKLFHHIVLSKLAVDEIEKEIDLDHLMGLLKKKDTTADQVEKFITSTMAPFIDQVGLEFYRCALLATKSHIKETPQCLMCIGVENLEEFSPCGHIVSCASCTLMLVNEGKILCPVCREEVVSHKRIDDQNLNE